jgi:peptidoglycan/LPS O-acetylase OafA/YrhL
MMSAKPAREPIFGLDFIRFFAASAVFFYHIGFKFFVFPIETPQGHDLITTMPGWASLGDWGWIGVQIFFVISGLVIAYSAEGNTSYDFLRSRIARLLPAMLICATLMAIIALALNYFPPAKLAFLWMKSVIFFPIGPWITGQIWTLPVEIAFYAIIWLMIMTRSLKHIEKLVWTLAILSAVYWVLNGIFHINDIVPRLTQLALLQHGCYFALGMLIFIIDRQGVTLSRLAVGLVCAATAILQIHYTAEVERQGHALPDVTVLAYMMWIAAIAIIIASLRWKTAISTALKPYAAIIRTLGMITYPVYLIHMHTGIPTYIFLLKAGVPAFAGLALTYLVTLAIALVITLWLEPPLHRLINNGLKQAGTLLPAKRA